MASYSLASGEGRASTSGRLFEQPRARPQRRWTPAEHNILGAHPSSRNRSHATHTIRAEGANQAQEAAKEPLGDGGDDAPRADEVLPDSLSDALVQAGEATSEALQNGNYRCLVEILLPEFWDPMSGAVFAEEGDQLRFWKLTRRFVDGLAACSEGQQIRLVYPDSGVAALLKHSWQDVPYGISSLTDRKPVEDTDELVVVAAPDPQGLDMCKKIAAQLENERPLVLFNPRLASGDVGVGLNVRRMRSQFLSTFTTTYSLRPVADVGSVFRRYPGLWQVFVEDQESPGRYVLATERPSQPAGELLDDIIAEALGIQQSEDGAAGNPSLFAQLQSTMRSLQRFAKQLSQ